MIGLLKTLLPGLLAAACLGCAVASAQPRDPYGDRRYDPPREARPYEGDRRRGDYWTESAPRREAADRGTRDDRRGGSQRNAAYDRTRNGRRVPPPRRQPRQPQQELFEPAQIVAIVGDDVILAGELLGTINQMLAGAKGQATERELREAKVHLMKRLLQKAVQDKMIYAAFIAKIPPERRAEALADFESKIREHFDKHNLPQMMEQAKVKTPAELDAQLRTFGSSLEKQRRAFAQTVMAQEALRGRIDRDPDVSLLEMLNYYRKHKQDFHVRARARFEQLMVRFDKFDSRRDAYREIARLGNRVIDGANLAAVARQSSQGPKADEGGRHDWTNQGALVSTKLDKALFSLPTGRLSPIIEADDGFYIIRVLERQEAGYIPFKQAQTKIREEIKQQKIQAETKEFLDSLQDTIFVWTIFDGTPAPGTRAASRP